LLSLLKKFGVPFTKLLPNFWPTQGGWIPRQIISNAMFDRQPWAEPIHTLDMTGLWNWPNSLKNST
jgi:hypothetical protein